MQLQMGSVTILALLLSFSQPALPAGVEIKCSEVESTIEAKSANLQSQIDSIKSLLMGSGAPVTPLPIDLLFKVDLKNQEQVLRRLKEVRKLTDTTFAMKTVDVQEVASCFKDPNKSSEVNALVGKLVELSSEKVRFFELEPEKRNILIESYNSRRALQSDQSLVNKEVANTEEALGRAQKRLSDLSTAPAEKSDAQEEDLAVSFASLQQYLADNANDHLEFLKLVNEKKATLEELRNKLNAILKEEQTPQRSPRQVLNTANVAWENAVDFISELFSGLQISASIDLPSLLPPKATFNESQSKEYSKYVNEYKAAQEARLQQTKKRTQIVDDLRIQAFQLLSESGKLRSRLFTECDKTESCDGYRSLNSGNLSDIAREIEIIPVKVRAGGTAKFLEVKGKFNAGFDGWLDLFQQFIAFIVLLLIPIILFKSLVWVNSKLDATRKAILAKSIMDFRKRTSLALWISRINPFIPAAGMALGIWIARQLVETTDIRELSQFIFYFQLYFVYRLFRLLAQIGLELLFSSESVADLKSQRERVELSARRISRLVFIEYALLHLIETTVRKALLYGVISSFVSYFNIFFIFWECSRWSREIAGAFKVRFPKYPRQLERILSSRKLLTLSSPFLLIAVAANDFARFLYSRLIKLDFFKKIHSEIFRRRIESDSEDDTASKREPPPEYLKEFDYYLPAEGSIFVSREDSTSASIGNSIQSWLSGKSTEDLVLVVGNRGMGKTTILNSLAKRLGPSSIVHRATPKTTDLDNFYSFLSEILKAPIKSVRDVEKLDESLTEKTVLILDDIQNFFLGKIGGFEVYNAFVEVLSLRTRNLFWCLSVNSRSWAFLKGSLGQEHLYGKVIELLPWRDFEIQNLILKRHDISGFKREFHQSIKAYGASGDTLGQQAETQFFRLLWGQSRGNPRSALMYWISAVSLAEKNKIVVGVPSFISSSLVGTMSDDSLFLLASIARHESLTQDEMQSVTSIQSTVIRKCVKEALDKELVWADASGRYRISSRAQYVIDYFLIGKNFLYE